MPSPSIIFSTYNSPEWLEKVIWGFSCQEFNDFELVIADDGSANETQQIIEQLRNKTDLRIKHIWQEDEGFRKTRILNKAIAATSGDYLIFTDGDCIPRADFVAVHMQYAAPGYFLSGGYFKLPMNTSQAITREDILNANCFNVDWLVKHGLKSSYKTAKLTASGWQKKLFNALTPTGATWNGHNASGWKQDIVTANGFDNRMQYGGEDRELGERLINAGIKSKQLRYSAICIHLDHSRGYVTQEARDKNRAIRDHTKKYRIVTTENGINEAAL